MPRIERTIVPNQVATRPGALSDAADRSATRGDAMTPSNQRIRPHSRDRTFVLPARMSPRAVAVRTAFVVWTLSSAALWLALIFAVRGF
jgi:hypothetical protein